MAEHRTDPRGFRPRVPAHAGAPAARATHQTAVAPALEIACPGCATFNPPAFRFCPQCGHRLRAPRRGAPAAARLAHPQRAGRLLVCLLWLVVVVETGLLVGHWPHRSAGVWAPHPPGQSVLRSEARVGHTTLAGRSALSAQRAAPAAPGALTAEPPGTATRVGPQPPIASDGTPVALTLFDREGDVLRYARGTWLPQEQRVVTRFTSLLGAYEAVIHFADTTTLPLRVVARADPEANVAVLAVDAPRAPSTAPPYTLAALARTTYEGTPASHRDLAAKRARAHRWEEALAQWQRVLALEPVLQPAQAAAFAAAVLHASAIVQAAGRHAEAHGWLLDAVVWVPEHGDLRLRLAESWSARGAYATAIAQYDVAVSLLPAHAAAITTAMVRVYQAWGQELLSLGHVEEAARRFRAALQLDSTQGEVYFALGQAEWRQRALEAALEAFEAALTYAPGLQSEVEPYLTKARALQGGPHTVVIDFPPGATRIEVPVVIDGRLEVPCIVDTGATVTLLPAWAAAWLGYRAPSPADWVQVQTAGGARRLPYATTSHVEIQGLSVAQVPVVFGDLPGTDGSTGLLGMDILRYFALTVDHDIGRLTLRLP